MSVRRVLLVLVTGCAVSATGAAGQSTSNATRPGDGLESMYVVRSWRESRIAPTDFCNPTRTRFVGSTVEDRYTFRSVDSQADTSGGAAILTPELEALLWHDFTYTEYTAQGFALLGDVAGILKWLARAADLGAGYYSAVSQHNAVWRPWLAHPDTAPVFEQIRANSARCAAIPLPPRAAAVAQSTSR